MHDIKKFRSKNQEIDHLKRKILNCYPECKELKELKTKFYEWNDKNRGTKKEITITDFAPFFSASQLKSAEFSAQDLKKAGFSLGELRDAGFYTIHLKKAGFSAKDLGHAGVRLEQLKNAGFSAEDLEKAGFYVSDLIEAGFSSVMFYA